MKSITKEEAISWLNARGCKEEDPHAAVRAFTASRDFKLTPDSGRKTFISTCVSSAFDGEGLVWISNYGVFSSCENRDLFHCYRLSFGENRPLHIAPAHVFTSEDGPRVRSIVGMSLYFFWDVLVVNSDFSFGFFSSHDEYCVVAAADEETLDRVMARVGHAFNKEEAYNQ